MQFVAFVFLEVCHYAAMFLSGFIKQCMQLFEKHMTVFDSFRFGSVSSWYVALFPTHFVRIGNPRRTVFQLASSSVDPSVWSSCSELLCAFIVASPFVTVCMGLMKFTRS